MILTLLVGITIGIGAGIIAGPEIKTVAKKLYSAISDWLDKV